MKHSIPKDKEVLNYYIKLARKNTNSSKITDILSTLVKLSAEKSIDSIQSEIEYIVGTKENPEYKKQRIRKIVEDNLYIIAQGIFSIRGSDDAKSNAANFILGIDDPRERDKFIDNTTDRLIQGEKFMGSSSILQRLVNQAANIEDMRDRKRINEGPASLDEKLEIHGDQFQAPQTDIPFAEPELEESTPESQIENIEKLLKEKQSPYLSAFLGNYKNKLIEIANQINQAQDENSKLKLMADFDKTMQAVAGATKTKYQDVKRFSKQSVAQLDEEFNKIRPDSELIDNIFAAVDPSGVALYKMPLMFRRTLEEHPDFAKLLFKTGLEAHLYTRLKKILGVRVPKEEQDSWAKGRRPKGLGEIWHQSLNQAIDETVPDENLREKFKRMAIGELMDHGQKEYIPGLRPVTDFFAPLVHSGLFMKLINQYGDKFTKLSPEEKHHIITQLVEQAHPMYEGSSNSPLPHVTPKKGNPRLFDVHDFDKYNINSDRAKKIMHEEMMNRFNNATDIISGAKPTGSLMEPREDKIENSENKISRTLNDMIVKYAFKP